MTRMDTNLILSLSQMLDIDLPGTISFDMLREKLASHINHLVQTDFENLVSLLYRIDVSEPKLKYMLKENPGEDAGKIIADLIIERQLQKIKSREQNSKRNKNINEEDNW